MQYYFSKRFEGLSICQSILRLCLCGDIFVKSVSERNHNFVNSPNCLTFSTDRNNQRCWTCFLRHFSETPTIFQWETREEEGRGRPRAGRRKRRPSSTRRTSSSWTSAGPCSRPAGGPSSPTLTLCSQGCSSPTPKMTQVGRTFDYFRSDLGYFCPGSDS